MKCRYWLGLLGLFWLWATVAQAEVLAIRTGSHGALTRVVIESDAELSYHLFSLRDPLRLVFDIEQQGFALTGPVSAQGQLTAVRYGQFSETTSRIVLDLRQAVQVVALNRIPPQDGSGYRLVIELGAMDAQAFRAETLDRFTSSEGGASLAPPLPLPPVQASNPLRAARVVDGILIPQPRPSAAAARDLPTLVIDPGHGGRDAGASSPDGSVQEKTITLAIARQLARALQDTGYYQVLLTREADRYLHLAERVEIGHEAQADLFISIHADANQVSSLHGLSVYTLSERASDALAASLAANENASAALAGIDVSDRSDEVALILYDLIHRDTINQALAFSQSLVDAAQSQGVALINQPRRSAGFQVLKSPDVPSVLVEVGFLTNPRDARRLTQADYQRKLVSALMDAIDQHFGF